MPPLAPIGLGMELGGMGLNYLGERQGIRSMADVAGNQTAEEEHSAGQQWKRVEEELNRRSGSGIADQTTADTTAAAGRNLRAVQPAAAAGGAALGLNAPATASVVQRELPAARLEAMGEGEMARGRRDDTHMGQLGIDEQTLQNNQEMRRSLYPLQMQMASAKGQTERTLGGLVQGIGSTALTLGMSAAKPAAGPAPGMFSTPSGPAMLPGDSYGPPSWVPSQPLYMGR